MNKEKRKDSPKKELKLQVPRTVKVMTLALGLSVSAFATTDAYKVNLNVKNVSVETVLESIQQQTGLNIAYSSQIVDKNRKVSLNCSNVDITVAMNKIIKGTTLKYEIKNGKIYLYDTKVSSANTNQQKKILVKGIVRDNNGEAIIGASVIEKGTTNGTVTDMDGKFSLTTDSNNLLEISFLGYTTQTIKTVAGKTLNITMKESSESLNEVVVVGYGVQKKVDLSGSVATVSTKVLNNRSVMTVGQALQGSAANLNVSIGSGQATDSPSFNVRGVTSINGGEPLVVIDGVVSTASELNRMNPSDIGNISILKDAASAAIYGSRAAFGVILVTTKTASQEKLTINYNNNFAMRRLSCASDIITDPYDVTTIRNAMYYPWGTCYTTEQVEYAKKRSEDPTISPFYVNPDGNYSYFENTDWYGETYKNLSFSTNHTIDISGKTDKVDYYFSAGYSFQNGMIKVGTDKFNRYNIRSKINFKLTDWWTLGNNTSFVTSDYESPYYLGSSFYWKVNRCSPLDPIYNPDGSYTNAGASIFGKLQDGGRWNQQKTTLTTHFSTQIDILKDVLWVNGSFMYSSNKNNEDGSILSVPYKKGPDTPTFYIDNVSSANLNNTNAHTATFDAYATFHKKFNKKHDFTAMVGFNQESWRSKYSSASRSELITDALPSINLATGDMNVSQSINTLALRSIFGRLNYIYNNKYILAFNGRYDGTSRFPSNSRFAFNPSGSAAWVVSEERFFEPLKDVVSFLKLRFSYGSLGNQSLSSYYPYLATMSARKTSQILDGKQPISISAPGLVSGNLTWEKVTTADWGLDFNLFDNRLTATVDAYIRRTKDMLTKGVELPSVLGTSVPKENAADLKTTGWDLTLNWRDQFKLSGKPFNYGLSFNIGDSRSWITKFANTTGDLDDYYVGYEIGTIWGLETEGFFTSQEDVNKHADQSQVDPYPGTPPMAAGDIKFKDLNNDNKINKGSWTLDDHGDYQIIGNSRARYNFGFTANADWNGFDFSIFIQGIMKKDYYPGSSDLYFWGVYAQPWTNITKGNYYDHWTEENPNAYFPRFKSYQAYINGKGLAAPQTKYLQNAAYARLKNLTIGYTLPVKWTSKINISRARVFFSGDNMLEISGLYKYYKMDPECLGGQMYPLQRSYSFGLNVTF